MQRVAVLADATGGDLGLFEGATGLVGREGFAGGAPAAGVLHGGEVAGDQDGFRAAAREAFPLAAGEGVEEVLDEVVQGGRLVGLARGAGEGFAAYGEGGGDGREDAVAAEAQDGCGGSAVGAAPAQAWVAGRGGRLSGRGSARPALSALVARSRGAVGRVRACRRVLHGRAFPPVAAVSAAVAHAPVLRGQPVKCPLSCGSGVEYSYQFGCSWPSCGPGGRGRVPLLPDHIGCGEPARSSRGLPP